MNIQIMIMMIVGLEPVWIPDFYLLSVHSQDRYGYRFLIVLECTHWHQFA